MYCKYKLFTPALLLFAVIARAETLPASVSFKSEPVCSVAAKLAAFDNKQVFCNSADFDKHTVTLNYTDANPTAEKYMKLLKAVLFEKGLGMIPASVGNLYLIESQRDLKDMHLPVFKSAGEVPEDLGYYTLVLPLKNFKAEDASKMFRNMMPPNTRIMPDEANNTVIITASGMHLRTLATLIAASDTPASAAMRKAKR